MKLQITSILFLSVFTLHSYADNIGRCENIITHFMAARELGTFQKPSNSCEKMTSASHAVLPTDVSSNTISIRCGKGMFGASLKVFPKTNRKEIVIYTGDPIGMNGYNNHAVFHLDETCTITHASHDSGGSIQGNDTTKVSADECLAMSAQLKKVYSIREAALKSSPSESDLKFMNTFFIKNRNKKALCEVVLPFMRMPEAEKPARTLPSSNAPAR